MPSIEPSPRRRDRTAAATPIPRRRANTRFSRLLAACGLSQEEAAAYLGISKGTVGMKASALRPMYRDEEDALVSLWQTIMQGGADQVRMPPGAIRMSLAQMEMRALSQREKAKPSTEAAGPDPKNS